MFDIGWDEMALIAAVSLVVIGPKDLPTVMRQVGRWTRKAREMASDFQRGVDDMMRESEVDDIKKQIAKVATPNLLRQEIDKAVDPTGELARAMELPALDLAHATEEKAAPHAVAPDASPPRPPEP